MKEAAAQIFISIKNSIIFFQHIYSDTERKELLLSKLLDLLVTDRDESALSEWIMYFLGKVQSNFNQGSNMENIANSLFSLDLFIFCIIVTAGCAIFVDAELNMKNRIQWLEQFPDALWLLSKRSTWTGHMPRVN